jgi:hypothetical protein
MFVYVAIMKKSKWICSVSYSSKDVSEAFRIIVATLYCSSLFNACSCLTRESGDTAVTSGKTILKCQRSTWLEYSFSCLCILEVTFFQFLKITHMKQGFRNEETSESGIIHGSILGQLLTEAMFCFLEKRYFWENSIHLKSSETRKWDGCWSRKFQLTSLISLHVWKDGSISLHSYCSNQLSAIGKRTVLSYILFASLMRHSKVSRLKDIQASWKETTSNGWVYEAYEFVCSRTI